MTIEFRGKQRRGAPQRGAFGAACPWDRCAPGLDAGVIDELAIIVAPVILGGGKALFAGFTNSLDLEHIGVRQMKWATLIEYRVKK